MSKRDKIPERSEKEKYNKLKGEVRQLRKLVKQLRKENSKLLERQAEYENYSTEIIEPIRNNPTCPKCNSEEITILEKLRGDKDYYVCKECESKGPYNS